MMKLSCFACCVASAWAASQCPASWSQDQTCLWPYQQQYKNFSVAGVSDKGAACCAACAADSRCKQWAVQGGSGAKSKLRDVCILNHDVVKGTAPQDPSFGCLAGSPPACGHATCAGAQPPKAAPKGAKNVLFFAVDDLRPEMEVFGGVPGTPMPKMHTPNIDALAKKSLVLRKNYVQQAVCSPTRQSLLTGRRPDRTRVYDLYVFFRDVAANYTTIPEFFKSNGYNTMGMGKIFHPGHASGAGGQDGKLSDDVCCSWSNTTFYYHAPNLQKWSSSQAGGFNSGKSWMSVTPEEEAAHPLPDSQTADHAVATLSALKEQRAAGDERPFFLAVGFHKPHLPFVASKKYFDYYPNSSIQLPHQQPPKGMPKVAWSAYGELRNYQDQAPLHASGAPGTVLPSQDVLDLRRAYYAAVTQTDDMLGRVMDALEKSGEAENTVISFWGDHGWQLGEHGEWCKHTNFEFAARAPMMVHVPGLTDKGITTDHYTEHVDLFPTLTEAAAGIQLDNCPPGDESFGVTLCTEGSSLVPLMKDPSQPVKTASFSQYPRGYQKPGVEFAEEEGGGDFDSAKPSMSACIQKGKPCTMGYTLVTQVDGHEYRYTEWADFNTKNEFKVDWGRIVGVELYNHSSDAGENFNINATKTSADVAALSAKLSKQLRAGPDAARRVTDASWII